MILNATHDGRLRVYALCEEAAQGFIADEITHHLSAAIGVAHDAPERIGNAAQAAAPALLLSLDHDLGREAHACGVESGFVRIRGGDARGLYHGILAFFEHLGFRWFAPGDAGTVTPQLGRITVADNWRDQGAPSIPWRGLHICGTGWTRDGRRIGHFDYETALWMARNRMNFKPIHNDEYDTAAPLLDELMLTPLAFGHSYADWLPASVAEEHPEYFALIADTRQATGQCCVSNPALRRHFVERILDFVEAHPGLPIVSIAPNDGYRFCQCEPCLALDTDTDREHGELNRRHHDFSAALAREVGRRHPAVQLSTIGYCNYLDPSDDIPREDNLAVSLCVTRAQNRALDDPESPSNCVLNERLDRWTEKAGSVFWSAYYLSYGGTFPRPYREQVVRTLQVLAAKGVQGIKSEVTPARFDRWQSAAFFLYLIARTAYDTEADSGALLEDFCRRHYGPAGDACLRYYRINEDVVRRFSGDMTHMEASLIPKLYSAADVAALQTAMAEAEQALAGAGDPVHSQRLAPLLRQAEEIAASRQAVLHSEAEAGPLHAPRSVEPPVFDDFDRLTWIEQRIRSNCLPFPTPGRFAVAWTDQALYLCFRMEEPDMGKATAGGGLEAGVWGHSSVDCFFAPDPASGVYFQVAANLLGKTYSARCRGREWDAGYDVAPDIEVRHGDNLWEMIMGLPFERLGMVTPSADDRIRLAVNRGQQCQSPRVPGGWPRGGSWHKIETMGEVVFSGTV